MELQRSGTKTPIRVRKASFDYPSDLAPDPLSNQRGGIGRGIGSAYAVRALNKRT